MRLPARVRTTWNAPRTLGDSSTVPTATATEKRNQPIRTLVIVWVLTALILGVLGWTAFQSYRGTQRKQENFKIEGLAGRIIYLNEILTVSARTAATTGDLRWEQRHEIFKAKLNTAFEEISELAAGDTTAEQARTANLAILEANARAFDLVRRGRSDDAQQLLFSDEYQTHKRAYTAAVINSEDSFRAVERKILRSQTVQSLTHLICVILAIPAFFVGWFVAIRLLNKWQAALSKSNKKLADLNRKLDQIVADSTTDLQSSEARTRAIVDAAIDAVISLDADGNVESLNPAAEHLFGYRSDAIAGKSICLIMPDPIPDTQVDQMTSSGRRHVRKVLGTTREAEGRRKNGETFPIELSVSEVRLVDRNLYTVIARDISQRIHAEQKLARQALESALLHRAAELAGETVSFEEALQNCVDMVCELTGWPVGHAYLPSPHDPQELVSAMIWHIEDPEACANLREVTQRTAFPIGEGMPGRIMQSGEPEWITNVQLDRSFLRNRELADLGVKGAFGFPVKIGDDVVAVLEFFAKEEMYADKNLIAVLRNVGEQLGRVFERRRTANMSDAMRTPLTEILRLAERLLETDELQPEPRERVETVLHDAKQLQQILQDDLDLSSAQAEQLEPLHDSRDPSRVVDEIMSRIEAIQNAVREQDMDRLGHMVRALDRTASEHRVLSIAQAAKRLSHTLKDKDDLREIEQEVGKLVALCHDAIGQSASPPAREAAQHNRSGPKHDIRTQADDGARKTDNS